MTQPPVARVRRITALFLLPYLLLGLFWVFANPPTAAPDENDHLVKALALGHLDIGVPAPLAPPGTTDLGQVRNASITRIVEIPARLSPDAYPCFRFLPRATAACQPASPPVPEGTLAVATTLGAYPPFLYPPVGLVASLGTDVPSATLLARLVVLAASMVLLGLGCAHLVRWLGVRSLVGVAVAVTPMAIFCVGSLTTSAVEILGALGVAAVVTVYARHPHSLREPRTLTVVLVCGTALVLSRQLGVVSLGVFTLLLLALGGWREILAGLRERSRMMWATVVVPLVAAVAVAAWEAGYDHPVLLGPWVSADSLDRFVRTLAVPLVDEAVGQFGWLDVRPPTAVNLVWFAAAVALVGAALVTGDRRDRLVLVGLVALGVVVSYVTYSRAFYGVNAGLQGRHILPILSLVPVWAGAVLARRRPSGPWRAGVAALAVALPLVVLVGFYLNAQRYAVGLDSGLGGLGDLWFVPQAQWAPPLGWTFWAVEGVAAAVVLGATWWRLLGRTTVGPVTASQRGGSDPS
ncbi:MAG: DUF2142 domain-containing protein, partial [Lapillicoccus sp.]